MPADLVVLVIQNEPNRAIDDELAAAGPQDVHLGGDDASPRDVRTAITDAHAVARKIGSSPNIRR